MVWWYLFFSTLLFPDSTQANDTLLLETEEVKQSISQLNHKVKSSLLTEFKIDDCLKINPVSLSAHLFCLLFFGETQYEILNMKHL